MFPVFLLPAAFQCGLLPFHDSFDVLYCNSTFHMMFSTFSITHHLSKGKWYNNILLPTSYFLASLRTCYQKQMILATIRYSILPVPYLLQHLFSHFLYHWQSLSLVLLMISDGHWHCSSAHGILIIYFSSIYFTSIPSILAFDSRNN